MRLRIQLVDGSDEFINVDEDEIVRNIYDIVASCDDADFNYRRETMSDWNV